jgi:hypothetical protein
MAGSGWHGRILLSTIKSGKSLVIFSWRRRYATFVRCSIGFGQLQKTSMQLLDLFTGIAESTVIVDDIGGDGEALVPASLRGNHPSCLFDGFAVTGQKALQLRLWITVNHDDAIHEGFERGLHEQGNNDDLVRSAGRFRASDRLPADSRMQDALDCLAILLIFEDQLSKLAALEAAIRSNYRAAEAPADFFESWHAWLHDIPCYAVSVDDRHTLRCEHFRNRCLAAGDTAGKADS